jgi:hypothetical protein
MDPFDFQSLLARETGGAERRADKRAGVEGKIPRSLPASSRYQASLMSVAYRSSIS